jgi:ABC-type Na+ transport system ATPase subunit NatA
VLSSHQIGEMEGICDSFTVLRHGEVVLTSDAAAGIVSSEPAEVPQPVRADI